MYFVIVAPVSNSPARIVHTPPENMEVLLGETLTLECVIEGSPVPWVGWDKYGGSLPEGRFTQELGRCHFGSFYVPAIIID